MALAAAASTSVLPCSTAETHLDYLLRNTQSCVLRPYCFFVSWQGVLTLAYRGFPPALASLKQQISDFYQSLSKESPGSRWPKTSLAAVREGRRLTPAQLQRLNQLCREQSGIFQTPGQMKAQVGPPAAAAPTSALHCHAGCLCRWESACCIGGSPLWVLALWLLKCSAWLANACWCRSLLVCLCWLACASMAATESWECRSHAHGMKPLAPVLAAALRVPCRLSWSARCRQ
eukprot:GHRQ01033033.1.p1 GENE.GHRQ01033033.1~~GHRQ01033033.1.p1  ORF type:complete len:259 (+),score=30.91 GHRQ01033033.1:84-779(+)